MFKINDLVVYENAGICRIEDICVPDFVGNGKVYYKLQSLEIMGSVVYVKVENEHMMRYLISKDNAKEYIESMNGLNSIYNDNSKSREREFLDIIKSRNWVDCLKMFKGIQQIKTQRAQDGKPLSTNDNRNMIKVDKIICGELAIAMGSPVEEIRNLLVKACV